MVATDEDRERSNCMAFNTSTRSWNKKINRIVFNEITKEAIHSAIKKPKK